MSHQRHPSLSQTQPQPRASSRTRSRSPISRPTTPLRPSSRTSFRASSTGDHNSQDGYSTTPLDSLEPQFAELADSMADLEANFMHLQLMHESLARFGESFAAFLYGLNMNAFVVDFPEAPVAESIKRWQKREREQRRREGLLGDETTVLGGSGRVGDETTMATGDTSYASMKQTPRRKSMAPLGARETPATASTNTSSVVGGGGRSGIPAARGTRGRGGGRAGAASGLPRGRGRGMK
jgi:DASH complex subunit DAM1